MRRRVWRGRVGRVCGSAGRGRTSRAGHRRPWSGPCDSECSACAPASGAARARRPRPRQSGCAHQAAQSRASRAAQPQVPAGGRRHRSARRSLTHCSSPLGLATALNHKVYCRFRSQIRRAVRLRDQRQPRVQDGQGRVLHHRLCDGLDDARRAAAPAVPRVYRGVCAPTAALARRARTPQADLTVTSQPSLNAH